MNRKLKLGLWLGSFIFSAGFIFPMILDLNPEKLSLEKEFLNPSWQNPFGFGENGVDLFSATVIGLRNSLSVSLLGALVSAILGTFLGLVAGTTGTRIDQVLVKIAEIFDAFPGIILVVGLAAFLGPSQGNVVFIVGITGWVVFFRMSRANILSLSNREFILASRALGQKTVKIWTKHLLPHVAEFLFVQLSLTAGSILIIESSLGFLGLGSPPGTPSLGGLIHQGRDVMTLAPHALVLPGLVLVLCIVTFNFLTLGLGEKFDSRRNIYTPKA
jgi:peptide/nickel transport system permease protein